jgi:hypothetical protein
VVAEYIPWRKLRDIVKEELTSDLTHGNHFSVIAPTGGGKTTLVTKGIIPMFDGVADVLLIDSTGDPKLAKYGKPYRRYGSIQGIRRLTTQDLQARSSDQVRAAMEKAYKQGQVVTIFDEVRHVTDTKYLGLQAAAESLWLFSRKRRNLVGGLTQAPRYVPSAFYDQSKLHFIFKIRDRRAMLRLAEIGGDYDTLKEVCPLLKKYEFAFVNSEGDIVVSKFDLKAPTVKVRKEEPRETIAAGNRTIQVGRSKTGREVN